MAGSQEIELKFLCRPEDLAAVLAAAPAGDDDETRELISVYFDTPKRTLQKAGASLRVRESKGRRVQTLKLGEGLAREEHEAPIDGDVPDPQLGPLRELLSNAEVDDLKPAFNVAVTRRQRLVRYGGAEIELALDQGEVRGGRAASAICEVELELKSGEQSALFGLARELSKAAPLYLSFDGKAARGQALVAGAPLQARRREKVALSKNAKVGEAFQAAARNALGQIAANAVVLREAPQVEATHQLRVAARRLRSALSTFKPIVADNRFEPLKAELRWLSKAGDAARNLDVFVEEVLEPATRLETPPTGLADLRAAVDAARETARRGVAEVVSSERFRLLMIDATAWVETGAWLNGDEVDGSAAAFAAKTLTKRRRKLRRGGRDLAHAAPAERHQARIEAKKLRYAAEGFSALFPPKKTDRFIDRLKDLQDALGELNDIATAEPLVEGLQLAPRAALAAGELLGLRAAHSGALVAKAEKAFEQFSKAAPFWT
jgi:inorganic triphosphatase YgiF